MRNKLYIIITLLCTIFTFGNTHAEQTPTIRFTIQDATSSLSINLLSYENVTVDWGNNETSTVEGPTPGQIKIDSPSALSAGSTISIYGNKINNIALNNKNITNIEFGNEDDFAFLSELYLTGNELTSLDVTKLTKLTILNCSSNQLTNIDLSQNTQLGRLVMTGNPLTSLDISANKALIHLNVINTGLEELDLSENNLLEEAYLNDNAFAQINLSNLSELKALYCANNQLDVLNLATNSNLKKLVCGNNKLTQISLNPSVTSMDELQCENNILNFASLPRVSKSATAGNFSFSPQDSLIMDNRVVNMTVDLEDQFSVSGNVPGSGTQPFQSTVTWIDITNGTAAPLTSGFTSVDGVYTFTFTTPKLIRAEIRNNAYSGLRVRTKAIRLPNMTSSIENTKKVLIKDGIVSLEPGVENCLIRLTDISGTHELLYKQNKETQIDLRNILQKGKIYILSLIYNDRKEIIKISM